MANGNNINGLKKSLEEEVQLVTIVNDMLTTPNESLEKYLSGVIDSRGIEFVGTLRNYLDEYANKKPAYKDYITRFKELYLSDDSIKGLLEKISRNPQNP